MMAIILTTTQVFSAGSPAEFTALQAWIDGEGVTVVSPPPYSSRVDDVAQREVTLVLDTPGWTIPAG
jgi:hypothetical protein